MNAPPIAHFIYIGSAMLLQIAACRFDCYGITVIIQIIYILLYEVKVVLLHLLLTLSRPYDVLNIHRGSTPLASLCFKCQTEFFLFFFLILAKNIFRPVQNMRLYVSES